MYNKDKKALKKGYMGVELIICIFLISFYWFPFYCYFDHVDLANSCNFSAIEVNSSMAAEVSSVAAACS